MERSIRPELLDSLPPTHPDALHNRRDLRLTNRFMRNYAWLARELPRIVRPGDTVLEVGAGDGALAMRLARRGIPVDGLDLWPAPAGWPDGQSWHQADVRSFGLWDRYTIIYGNLIFHQFADPELQGLGGSMQDARAVLACEPARRRSSQVAYAALAPLFGANHVSLHDGHVSIAAGFLGNELPCRLGFEPPGWDVRCSTAFPGAYHMVALRTR